MFPAILVLAVSRYHAIHQVLTTRSCEFAPMLEYMTELYLRDE